MLVRSRVRSGAQEGGGRCLGPKLQWAEGLGDQCCSTDLRPIPQPLKTPQEQHAYGLFRAQVVRLEGP